MKIALYMRVSTDDQTNANQEIRLQELAAFRQYEIVQIYQDQESGAKRSRPALEEMLSDAQKGKFQAVLTVKVDRIARSLRDLLEIAGTLGQYNVDLLFADQNIDIKSAEGKLMYLILGAFAEFEREIIVERTKAGLRRARKAGRTMGRPKIHHEIVERVKRLHADGMSYRLIQQNVTYQTRDGKLKHISKAKIGEILEGVIESFENSSSDHE